MANSKRGEPLFNPCTSANSKTRYQNQSTCTCCSKKYFKKATEVVSPLVTDNIIPKQTCTRCYSHRKSVAYKLEPYKGLTIQSNETDEPDSQASPITTLSPSTRLDVSYQVSKQPTDRILRSNDKALVPKEIMNSWVPGSGRLTERYFTPSENYVDVSPRGFSMKKYFPELYLSDARSNGIRTHEQENQSQEECRDFNSSPNDPRLNKDWLTIIDGSAIGTPCPWNDDDLALARERDEVSEEESAVKDVRILPKSSSKWFRWSCKKSKQHRKD